MKSYKAKERGTYMVSIGSKFKDHLNSALKDEEFRTTYEKIDDKIREKYEAEQERLKKKNTLKNFMLEQLDREENSMKRDIRFIRNNLKVIDELKAKTRQSTEAELSVILDKDGDLKEMYNETVRIANLTFEEYSEEFDKLHGLTKDEEEVEVLVKKKRVSKKK